MAEVIGVRFKDVGRVYYFAPVGHKLEKGQKVVVDGPEYETAAGVGPNCGITDPQVILELNFYCDTYGVDTISWGTMRAFLMECYENGILNKERTGGLELNFGNSAAALELLHLMAKNEGFGKIAALGSHKQKELFIKNGWGDAAFLNDIAMEQKGLEYSEYGSKESLAQQGGYGLTNKGPQHDEAWLIFMDQVNNQIPTFDDKAEALYYYPRFRTWFGLVGLCKLPWNDVVPENNALTDEPAKEKRSVGRPKKIVKPAAAEDGEKRGRGRPKKTVESVSEINKKLSEEEARLSQAKEEIDNEIKLAANAMENNDPKQARREQLLKEIEALQNEAATVMGQEESEGRIAEINAKLENLLDEIKNLN